MTAQGNQREAALYAYLAGIIDGEGCLRVSKSAARTDLRQKNPVYGIQITVGMGCLKICQLLQDTFGGSIYTERVQQGRKTIHRWRVTSKRGAAAVLKKVMPYLIEKREQAECLLEYCRRVKAPENCHSGSTPEELQFREDTYRKMSELKRTEAPATTERADT